MAELFPVLQRVIPLGNRLAADVQGFPGREAVPFKFFDRKPLLHVDRFHLEASSLQALWVVLAVNAYVVVLAKSALAFRGVCDAGVFVGGYLGWDEGDLEKAPSAGFHNPMEFPEALGIVGDVFQNMVAENDVEPVVFQGYMVQVEVEICQGRFDVSSQNAQVFLAFEPSVETLFRCYVQELLGAFKEVGVAVEVDPKQAVAFQGVGAGGQRIFTDLVSVAIGQKRAVGSAVDGVGKAFSCPNQGSDPLEHVTQSDQPRSGDVAEGPANHAKRGSCLGSPKAS
jgi:hypothetical protein